jgi:TrmH family RNA methyltransferase
LTLVPRKREFSRSTRTPSPLFPPPILPKASSPSSACPTGLQDPGNAGAIVRSAEAFGATGVVFLRGSASPYHPKTLRAAAGSLFRLPFLAAAELPVFDFPVYATAKSAAQPIDAVDWRQSCGFVIGSEGQGVRPEILAACQPVTIPTETVESLNAAVAAGIVLYEARRQRSRP